MLPLGQPFAPIEAFARLLTWPGRTWWELLHEPTPFETIKRKLARLPQRKLMVLLTSPTPTFVRYQSGADSRLVLM